MKKEQTALELIREASFETEPDRNNSDRAVNLTIAECMIEKAKKEVFEDLDNLILTDDDWSFIEHSAKIKDNDFVLKLWNSKITELKKKHDIQ